MARSLRPARADDLGMRHALSDRLLPLLVGAMVFLAALALAGAIAASGLAAHWRGGAAAMVTVTVPNPDAADGAAPRADRVAHVLAATPGLASYRRLPDDEIASLLKPWLGEDLTRLSAHMPAIFEVRLGGSPMDPGLAAQLEKAAPGSLIERNGEWLARLADLVRSLQACAALALVVVTGVAAAVVSVATRAGLAARRESIEIVHGLGATDRLIAGQFARRVTWLAVIGAVIGLAVAVPVLLGLATLAAPFQAASTPSPGPAAVYDVLPHLLWLLLASLPLAAGLIGWVTGQAVVRGWLRRLP